MARKKSVTKLPKVHEMIDTKTENLMPAESAKLKRRFPVTKIALAVVLLGLVAIFVSNKGLLVAAIVNGQPIFRWQLNSVLASRYGQQTLDSMVSEMLVDSEAKKAGVTVSQEEIAKKESDLVSSLGSGVRLEDVLAYQGMTKADFEQQIRLQLTVEKLLGKDITITDTQISDYIATNASTLTATDEAGLREEARQAIFSQELNNKLQTWFASVKAKASVLRFL